jgi:hypothetical protein
MQTVGCLPIVNMMGTIPSFEWRSRSSDSQGLRPEVTVMKRTLFALGLSTVLTFPVLVSGQVTPSTPGTGSGPGPSGSGFGSRMEQEERRGHTALQAGEIRQVQERLKEAGYNPGPTDGQLGPQTKDALKEYQKAQGLPQTGQLDAPTKELLMAQKLNGPGREMQRPLGSTQEEGRPMGSMPGSRTPSGPGAGSMPPAGPSSSR